MDISQVATEQLEAELVAHAAWETAGMARMLVVLAEFDRRQAWASWGCRNAQHWLSWKCGLGYTAATERLRVAHHLHQFPAIRESFTTGQITWSKVREITRVATPTNEAEYVDLARCMTASQLSRLVRAKRRVSAADAIAQHENRAFSWHTEPDGSITLTVKLPAEHAMPIIAAVHSATTHTAGITRAAAFADTFQQLINQQISAATTVTVHIDTDNCTIENGPAIAFEIAEQIACNHGATLTTNKPTAPAATTNTSTTTTTTTTTESDKPDARTTRNTRTSNGNDDSNDNDGNDNDGNDNDGNDNDGNDNDGNDNDGNDGNDGISGNDGNDGNSGGRSGVSSGVSDARTGGGGSDDGEIVLDRRRTATKRQRNWIARRHPTCQFPGCHHAGTFEVHHVQHHANGGRSTINNYARLCEHHHRYVHLHHLTLTMNAARDLIVTLPNGAPLDRAIERLDFDPPEPTDPNQIGDNWYNDRLNLDYIISVLIHNETVHQQRLSAATAPTTSAPPPGAAAVLAA